MSCCPVINRSLKVFDEIQQSNKQYTKTVNAFIKTIKYLFHLSNAPDFCKNCYFIRYGSNRERTVVHKDADFDLAMVLPYPFTLDMLYATWCESEDAFMLNLKRGSVIDSSYNDFFTCGKQRKLLSFKLRTNIFNCIANCIEPLKNIWDGWTIGYKKKLAGMEISFHNHRGKSLTIDVIPQIGARLERGDIPSCIPMSSLYSCMQSYIEDHNFSTFFVLGFPPHVSKLPMKHLLVHINFGLLELCSIACSENVRNTVRMCKSISLNAKLKEKGLASYHIKRMALLCLGQIINSDPYNGIEILFRRIHSSLVEDFLPDYFLPRQNFFIISSRKAFELADEIEDALHSIFTLRQSRLLHHCR